MPSAASWPSAYGLTVPAGWLPALKTSKRWPAHARSVASASTLRAEFPVQRNRTRRFIDWIQVVGMGSRCDQQARPTAGPGRSEEHTSELHSLMRISYSVFCLKKKIPFLSFFLSFFFFLLFHSYSSHSLPFFLFSLLFIFF